MVEEQAKSPSDPDQRAVRRFYGTTYQKPAHSLQKFLVIQCEELGCLWPK